MCIQSKHKHFVKREIFYFKYKPEQVKIELVRPHLILPPDKNVLPNMGWEKFTTNQLSFKFNTLLVINMYNFFLKVLESENGLRHKKENKKKPSAFSWCNHGGSSWKKKDPLSL